MEYRSVAEFIHAHPLLPRGVVGILLCESRLHAAASARRMIRQGIAAIIAIGDAPVLKDPPCPIIRISEDVREGRESTLLNPLFDMLAGRWVLWQWNGEFFFYPFSETRSLGDFTTFLDDERRVVALTCALDLYADDLPRESRDPETVALWFDRLGYQPFPRGEKTLRLFGGLGWRFEEMTPEHMQQLTRASLLKPEDGVHIGRDLIFEEPAYASFATPWHHSPTAAMMTLRRAWRILAHPHFNQVRKSLHWHGSTRFEWSSGQLLELGMIEPGQWF